MSVQEVFDAIDVLRKLTPAQKDEFLRRLREAEVEK